MKTKTYDILKKEFIRIIKENNLESEEILVQATPLSPEEAIGNPEDRDYPLIIGRERLMQAEFKDSLGQAFTDMYGNYSGPLSDVVATDLTNNFQRAIFISSLNAVMKYLGLITRSTHCRNDEPRQCSYELAGYIEGNYGHPRIAFVGFQPRMVETLAKQFEIKVTDLDQDNIGTEKFGVIIHGPEKTGEHLDWCDIALVTGTTIVNETVTQLKTANPVIFYGVTISGAAKLLGLNHFCHFGR